MTAPKGSNWHAPKRLGLVLKTLRKLAGLSQRALAKSAHTTAGYVAIQEAGRKLVARADAVGAWVGPFNRDVMTASDGFGSGPTRWAVQQTAWQAISVRKR